MTEISATQQRKINYQSDFDFLLRLTDSEGTNTGFPSYDWRLELFSSSGYGHKFTVSSVGGVLTNCFDDNGTIHVVCDNHKLGVGELCGKFFADIPNSIYADGIQLTVTPFSLGIILTTGASDDIVGLEVENAIPIAIVTAYQMAVANGYTGTKEEYVSAISEMPGMVTAMAATIETLRSNVSSLQELTTQTSDEVFINSESIQGLSEKMRMKANVADVPSIADFNQVSDDVAFALDETQGLREIMRMKANVSDVSELREQVESEITAREEAISTIEHPVELADTEDADFMIADENQNAILTIKNGHIKTAKFDSSNIQTQSSTTSATATATPYRYYQPYNAEADLLFRDARLRARYSGYLPLIFVCGQSNADGRADYTTAPEWLSSNDYKVEGYKMWNATTGQFSDYSVTGNNGADGGEGSDGTGVNKFSFDPFFAKSFVDEFGGNLYAIRQSMGGISIQSQPTTGTRPWTWQPKISTIVPGCNSMCLALMNKYKAASDYAEENNLKLLPIGVLWHQGESDADEGYCAEYKQNLMNVVSWIRGMVDEPTLPFVSGYVMRDHSVAYRRINVILSEMETYDPYCKAVDMDGHYTSIDGLHYDADALAYMGETMFGIYKDIAYKQ